MADTIRNIVTGLVLTLLVTWLALGFLTGGANEYGVSTAEIDAGDRIDYAAINATLFEANNTASSWQEKYEDWGVFAIPAGILSFGQQMLDFIVTPFQLVGDMAHNVLGIPRMVLNIIWVLLIITFLFAVWRLWRQGD